MESVIQIMKINLYNDINRDEFIVKDVIIANECCYLVTPKHIGTKWTRDNLIFRSSIWNSNGELISAGFKNFFNYQEQPDLEYQPTDLKGCTSVEKLDGSLLIVSKYKGEMIYRTRGTNTVVNMENSYEIPLLVEKYKKFFKSNIWYSDTTEWSYLFEWITPTNKIVINYGDEGDVVRVRNPYDGCWSKDGGEVIFSTDYVGGWVITSNGKDGLNIGTRTEHVEVIGNIHEERSKK